MIIDAEQLSRPDIIIVGVFTIGIFGYLIDYFFFKLTQKLIYSGGKEDEINHSNQKFN
jgi:sulfonate transport system permease protein